MAGMGYGIGSFLEGLTKGALVGNQLNRQDTEDKLAERRMKLAESSDARAATAADLSNRVTQTNLDNSVADRAANAPILEAQRKSALGSLNDDAETRDLFKSTTAAGQADYDAEKAKSIVVGKDAAGNPTYTVDGQPAANEDDAKTMFERQHGTAMDMIRAKVIPAITKNYVARGDLASADRFQKWSDDKDVQNGIEDLGRATQSLRMGDWESASKSLNKVAQNGTYVSQDHHDMAFEPIKDDAGKQTGVRMTYTDKQSGKKLSRDFSNPDEAIHAAGAYLSPQAAFEQAKTDYASTQAAKAEKQKTQDETTKLLLVEKAKGDSKIEEERAKSAFTIAQERAKSANVSPEKYLSEFAAVHKNLSDSNLDFQKASPDVQAKMAADVVDAGIKRGQSFIAPQGTIPQAQAAPQDQQSDIDKLRAIVAQRIRDGQGTPVAQQPAPAEAAPAQRSVLLKPAGPPTLALPPQRRVLPMY